jgi:hypothetical protein
MPTSVPRRLLTALLAALLFLGCAASEPQVLPISVDAKMTPEKMYLDQSDHLPGD